MTMALRIETVDRMLAMLREGVPQRDIAAALGITRSTVTHYARDSLDGRLFSKLHRPISVRAMHGTMAMRGFQKEPRLCRCGHKAHFPLGKDRCLACLMRDREVPVGEDEGGDDAIWLGLVNGDLTRYRETLARRKLLDAAERRKVGGRSVQGGIVRRAIDQAMSAFSGVEEEWPDERELYRDMVAGWIDVHGPSTEREIYEGLTMPAKIVREALASPRFRQVEAKWEIDDGPA